MTWRIKVKKQTGAVEKFDQEKIASSIFKAARRVGGTDRRLARQLGERVVNFLKKKFPKRKIISSDEIGNMVEKVLIEEKHVKTAKVFILYREGQRKARKKLVKFKDLTRLREFLKLTDQRVVFVTGVYDLFHIGHARYLKKASLQGDILVVGLNSDESVRKLKSESRPVLGEEIRAEMLSCFDFIDYIVIYSELNAAKAIKALRPDVYVCVEGSWKGRFEDKPEVKEVKKYKGKVLVFSRQSSNVSTTTIVRKIKTGKEGFKIAQLVVGAFLVEDGKLLLVKQKNRHFWTPPGGLVDFDEDPEKACIREAKEELGLDINCYGILPPTVFLNNKSQERFLILNYIARRNRGQKINLNTKANQDDEGAVEKYRWIRFGGLDKIAVGPNVLPVVRELSRSLKLQAKLKTKGGIKKSVSKKHRYFMRLAEKEAKKSTCWFRKTGCLVVKNGQVLLSAYNRVMPDEQFCQRTGCIRQELGALPGEKLELCVAIHAEANLISQAAKKGIPLEGATMYLTTFPCSICAKAVAISGVRQLVFRGDYSNFEGINYLKRNRVKLIRLEEK